MTCRCLTCVMFIALALCSFCSEAFGVSCLNAATVATGRSLQGQVIVMTGGDTGLGLETTKALATTGATIVIGAFNVTHGNEVAEQVRKDSSNPNIFALPIDLSNFSSVKFFASTVVEQYGNSNITTLINDAGIDHSLSSLSKITADGFERVFQVNYLGPFLLTELLLPSLRKNQFAKIINVASAASFDACSWGNRKDGCMSSVADWDTDVRTSNGTLPPSPPPCGPNEAGNCNAQGTPASNYGLTKFAQVAHAQELDWRELNNGSNVRAFSLHPGFVATPMTADIAAKTAREWCVPLPYVPGICPIKASAGAATQTYLAVAGPEELGDSERGQYFVHCKVAKKANYTGWIGPANFFDLSKTWLRSVR